MNERIEKLNRLALGEVLNGQDPDNDIGKMYVPAQFTKKFAELIVRECIELIDNKQLITAAETYDEVFVARYDALEESAKKIREHFGVEE